jgi:hypothetical protein
MTTIAYADGILAVDSRMTAGHTVITDRAQKLFNLQSEFDGVEYQGDELLWMAFAGHSDEKGLLLEKLESCQLFNNKHEKKWEGSYGIILGEQYVYTLRAEGERVTLIRFSLEDRLTEGSGADFARAGLEMGLGAIKAVKLAIKLDSASGGEVCYNRKYSEGRV